MISLWLCPVAEGMSQHQAGLTLLDRAAHARWPQLPPDPVLLTESGGKPYFRDYPRCHFNLSHSGGWVLCALGDGPVGVDLQIVRESPSQVGRKFTGEEQTWLSTQPPEAVYSLWAKKEAYLKYLGLGLTRRLDSFSVLPLPRNQVEPEVVCALIQIPLEGFACALCGRASDLSQVSITAEGVRQFP
jgi:4'-phosphopantetheinyl transferase